MTKARKPAPPQTSKTRLKKRSSKRRTEPAVQAAAEAAFRRAAVARGDAVPAGAGTLPPGATFEIEGHDEKGTPILKRKRFSIG